MCIHLLVNYATCLKKMYGHEIGIVLGVGGRFTLPPLISTPYCFRHGDIVITSKIVSCNFWTYILYAAYLYQYFLINLYAYFKSKKEKNGII